MMRLVTVGTGTVSLSPSRVCAGHLVEAGSVRLLMDCGSGVAHRLASLELPWREITHIALTHFHLDHVNDLATLFFAWKYGSLPGRHAPLSIIGPVGTAALLEQLAVTFGDWLREPGFAVSVIELEPGGLLELGDGVALRTAKVPHTDESVAYSVERGGRRIVYSGDMGYDPEFAVWARGADLLLCECSLPVSLAIPTHLTPEDCGAIAAAAVPLHLVLTHFYPPVLRAGIPAIIGAQFAGRVTLAEDGTAFEIAEG